MIGLANAVKEPDFDINARNSSGQTGLEIACGSRRVDAVKFLLQNGADPTLKNEQGQSVMDNIDDYDEQVQALLNRKARGEFDAEIKRSQAMTNREHMIIDKLKAKLHGEISLEAGVTEKEVDEHNDKMTRIVDSLIGKKSEKEVLDLVVGTMVPCYFTLLTIRSDSKRPSGQEVEKQLGKKYYEMKTFTEVCDQMKDLVLQLGIDDEHLDDLIDVVSTRTRVFYQVSDAQTINEMKMIVAKMLTTEVLEMFAKGEIGENPHRE